MFRDMLSVYAYKRAVFVSRRTQPRFLRSSPVYNSVAPSHCIDIAIHIRVDPLLSLVSRLVIKLPSAPKTMQAGKNVLKNNVQSTLLSILAPPLPNPSHISAVPQTHQAQRDV